MQLGRLTVGDPTTATSYMLCLYDETGDAPSLVSETIVPPSWVPSPRLLAAATSAARRSAS